MSSATKIEVHGRRLRMKRWFRAPRQLVWKTFEDPVLLSQWWGPRGFTCPVARIDFRVGGEWHTVIRSADGLEIPSASVFTDIVEPERIAYDSIPVPSAVWNGNPPPPYSSVISLADRDGGTELLMQTQFETNGAAEDAIRRGFADGTLQSHDKLARLLDRQAQDRRQTAGN